MFLTQKELKRAIFEEKSKINPLELFLSSAYTLFLLTMVTGIVKTFKGTVHVAKSLGGTIAYTDSSNVFVSVENSLTQNLNTVETHMVLCGLVLHECGHILFTDFELSEMCRQRMKKGEIYPLPNKNPYLNDVQNFLSKNLSAADALYAVYNRLDNCIEDGFVDRIMKFLIPGYGKCLSFVAKIDNTFTSTYKEMVQKGFPEQAIFTNLVLSYARHGQLAFDEDDEDKELIKLFLETTPIIKKAVFEKNAYQRRRYTFEVFCYLFHFVKIQSEKPQAQAQGPSNTDDSNNIQGDAGENDSNECNENDQKASDSSNNANGSSEDSESSMEESCAGNESLNDFNDTATNSQSDEKDSKNSSSTSSNQNSQDETSDAENGNSSEESNPSSEESSAENESGGGFNDSSKDSQFNKEDSKNSSSASDGQKGQNEAEGEECASSSEKNNSSDQNSNSSLKGTFEDETSTDKKDLTSQNESSIYETSASENDSKKDSKNSANASSSNECDGSSCCPSLKDLLDDLANSMEDSEKNEHRNTVDNQDSVDSNEVSKLTSTLDQLSDEKKDELSNNDMKDVEASEVSTELERTMDKIATEKVAQIQEKEIRKQANSDISETISQTKYHKNISFTYERVQPNPYGDMCYESEKSELDAIVRRFLKDFKSEIDDRQKGDILTGLYNGKRIKANKAYRYDKRIFSSKIAPEDIPDMAIGIMIDCSGSMCGTRIETAIRCAYITYKFCKELNIPVFIIGHDTYGETVRLHSVVDDKSIDRKDERRIFSLKSGGSNRDGFALRYCLDKLRKINVDQKIMFIISDGRPAHFNYGNAEGKADCQDAVRCACKDGILTITAGIGDAETVRKIYTDGVSPKVAAKYLDLSDLKRLPKAFIKIIKEHLK